MEAMRVASAIFFLVFLIHCSLAQKKKKDDKQPRPAVISYSGCELKEGALKKCAAVSNKGIQMGEAWANPRVHGQLFAVFVPYKPGERNYGSEGGPYGDVTAWDCNPTEGDMAAIENPANWCMFWDAKDTGKKQASNCEDPGSTSRRRRSDDSENSKKEGGSEKSGSEKKPGGGKKKDPSGKSPSGKSPSSGGGGKSPKGGGGGKSPKGGGGGKSPSGGGGEGEGEGGGGGGGGGGGKTPSGDCPAPRPKAPGEEGLPMPIVCPHNLIDCYSADWYSPGGKLAKYADMKPTYKGIWFPPKNKLTKEPMFCKGLNLGCPTPTMLELQLHKLGSVGCDVSKCKEPPAAK